MVELAPVPAEERAELRAMMTPYLVEHADQVDPGRIHGDPTEYEFLDLYWQEPERRPFWIMDDGERAGFALVNRHAPSGQAVDHAVAEFYIRPEHRRGGLGVAALRALLRRFPGQWELQVFRANAGGFDFWPRAIAAAGVADWHVLDQVDRVIHRFRA